MFENRLKALWAQGRPAINGWLSVGNPFIAEIMACQGYDSITIDLQHGALDYGQALPMFQALRASGVVPLARVPWNEAGSVMKVLDAGAMGVICPMINSAAEAAQFVSYLRYPPLGQRSFGPTRASFAYGGYDTGAANDQILALDGKVSLDDNAEFRHEDHAALADKTTADPLEEKAKENDLNYVKLDG